ncbi:O-antigen polymerase [Lacinutrix sp.]|uniref:O-antigen polymerase n=1 Tax=Lacinutrix sp. TaxID=1937692 RepID=UPI0035C7ED4F
MKTIGNKKYLELYYVVISLFYFLSTKNTWVFRKLYQNKDVVFEFNFLKYIFVSIFVFFTIRFFKNQLLDSFSRNILGLLLILDFIPSSIFYSSTSDSFWQIYLFHIILFYSLAITLKVKFKINLITFKKNQVLYFLILITLIGTLPYLRYIKHIDLNNLLLKDVYITRIKFRELFDTYSGYTHSWFSRVIIPIIFVLALKYKLKSIAILNTILLVFLYLMGAVKSVLLGSVLVIIFYFINKDKILPFLTKALIFMLIFSIIMIPFVIHDRNFFGVIVFRRMMFIPQVLDYCYYDFFNNNYLYWSNSFLKGFLSYPYDTTSPRIIGEVYFNKEDMAANNGLISDGFSNAGWIGVIITLFLFNGFMLIIKNCRIDSKFFGIYFFILYGFITTAISTVLITHGGLLLLIISFFLLREKKTN